MTTEIIRTDKTGNRTTYSSVREAAQANNIPYSTLASYINGCRVQPTTNEYYFESTESTNLIVDCVYKVSVDKHYYIGSTSMPIGRRAEHLTKLKANKHHNKRLQKVYNMKQDFDFIILEEKDEVATIEKHKHDPYCCNIRHGTKHKVKVELSDGKELGFAKIKDAADYFNVSYSLVSLWARGKSPSPRHSNSKKYIGTPLENALFYYEDQEIAPPKDTIQLEFKDGSIKTFKTKAEAAKFLNISTSLLGAWANGRSPSPRFSNSKKYLGTILEDLVVTDLTK